MVIQGFLVWQVQRRQATLPDLETFDLSGFLFRLKADQSCLVAQLESARGREGWLAPAALRRRCQ